LEEKQDNWQGEKAYTVVLVNQDGIFKDTKYHSKRQETLNHIIIMKKEQCYISGEQGRRFHLLATEREQALALIPEKF
jgi:hypothetical protein